MRKIGADMVAQPVKLPLGWPTSHIRMPVWLKCLVPCHLCETRMEFLASFWSNLGMNKQMKYLFLNRSLPLCHSNQYFKKRKK